jgi:ferredoxin
MKHIISRALAIFIISFFGFALTASAAVTPSLSFAPTGTGDQVTVNINGDANVSVLISYSKVGSGPQIVSLGSTNSSGNFSTTLSSSTYGLASGTLVTAILNGTSGQYSSAVAWPTVSSSSSLKLSQSSVVVNVGSSTTVSATNLGSDTMYVSNNSNPAIANVSISGDQVTIHGNTNGSTTITLCQVGNTTDCPTVYTVVQSSGTNQLSLSQTNATVVKGQNLPITISGGSGNYQIFNNSNSSKIQASINGSVLTLSTTADNNTTTASLLICTTDMAMCSTVNATTGSSSSVALSFSNSAPTVSVNKNTTVTIYGPSGVSFYVSSNSNPSVVQANLSGSTLTLAGIATGSSSVKVCASTGNCASTNVTVTYADTVGRLTLSQTTLSLLAGQSSVITITGGEQPYSVSGGNSAVSQQTLSDGSLTVYGVSGGTSQPTVCSAGGGCLLLTVTVNGTGSTNTTSTTALTMSQNNISLALGQSTSVSLYGTGGYFLSNNSYPNIASVALNGSTVSITGLSAGTTYATMCMGSGSCATLTITVTGGSTTSSSSSTTTTTPVASSYTFTKYLTPGSENSEVTELQKVLIVKGYLNATAVGYFGPLTEKAVKAFQKDHNLDQLGVVGPGTRAALNALTSSGSTTSTSSSSTLNSMTLAELQAQVQAVQAELVQLLSRISQLSGQ